MAQQQLRAAGFMVKFSFGNDVEWAAKNDLMKVLGRYITKCDTSYNVLTMELSPTDLPWKDLEDALNEWIKGHTATKFALKLDVHFEAGEY